jgi:hypothetical protein
MTDCASRSGRRLAWSWVCVSILACAAPPTTRVVASVAPPVAAPSGAEPESSPAPIDSSTSDTTADSVVTLIAKPGLWPLDVESARRVLSALGPVKREQPTPNDLSLVGGPYGTLDRFDVDYSLDEGRYWVFDSAGFLLGGRDVARLYHAMEARLTQLLGKPASSDGDDGAPLPTVTWDLGEAVLSLAPSTDAGERRVMIAIHESAP